MTKTKKSAALLKILVIAAILILLPIVTPNMYIMQIINMIGIYIILGVGINVLPATPASCLWAKLRSSASARTPPH